MSGKVFPKLSFFKKSYLTRLSMQTQRTPFTEDQLVEQPAIGLFAALGWETVSALDESFGATGSLGRETNG